MPRYFYLCFIFERGSKWNPHVTFSGVEGFSLHWWIPRYQSQTWVKCNDINIYIYIYIYDEAVNITSEPHTQNGTCTISKENLAESNGVVPAEYPQKVKLKLFSQLYSARKWYNMHTLICEGIGVFIVVEGWPPFLGVEVFPYRNHLALSQTWWTRYFLIEKILINMCIFRNPFCARIPLI